MASKTISADTRAKLLDVIEVLKSVKPETFDMTMWSDECKTAGCAIGHYVFARPNCDLKLEPIWNSALHPSFNGKRDFSALSDYFGITIDDTQQLFDPDSYECIYSEEDEEICSATPQDVIDRVRDFLGEPISDEERGAMMEGDRFE